MRAATRAKAEAANAGHFQSFPLLVVLEEQGPLRSNVLAEAAYCDPSTVSRQVARLFELGYVDRLEDPDDGRATLLVLTAAGRAALAERLTARDEYLARMTADWSAEDREQFALLFDRFSRSFAAHLPEPHPHHHNPNPTERT